MHQLHLVEWLMRCAQKICCLLRKICSSYIPSSVYEQHLSSAELCYAIYVTKIHFREQASII